MRIEAPQFICPARHIRVSGRRRRRARTARHRNQGRTACMP